MNILMMSKIFTQSGVGTHIKDLSKQLTELGHCVYIMSSTNDWDDFCPRNSIQFQQNDFSMSPVRMIKNLREIRKYLLRNQIDVVHCHHRTCGLYMRLLSKRTGVPFVWTNHLDNIPHGFLHRMMTFHGKKAICVSSELKKFCVDDLRIPANDVEVIIHGIRPSDYYYDAAYVDAFKASHNITDERIIGLFARMAPMKDHSCLIKALATIPESKLCRTKTVLFGGTSGEYVEQLKREIRENGLEKHILFEGFVTPSQALSLSDITVLPSQKEGFGIVSIESFLMRKPHIRTKTAGYEDIKDGCIGFDVGDSDALGRELEQYIDGKDYSDLLACAHCLLEEKCTLDRMTARILQVYKEVCHQQ